jgi:hypothetical protein
MMMTRRRSSRKRKRKSRGRKRKRMTIVSDRGSGSLLNLPLELACVKMNEVNLMILYCERKTRENP